MSDESQRQLCFCVCDCFLVCSVVMLPVYIYAALLVGVHWKEAGTSLEDVIKYSCDVWCTLEGHADLMDSSWPGTYAALLKE